ncbi:MAG: DUF1223 domain-containing protein [Hyphomicrobiales bacterium]
MPIFTLLTVFIAVSSSHRAVAGQSQPVAVVELFTSQACDSCPPADNFLGTLQGSQNVITMSLNVDYWDYLGWKDTLGSPDYTRRQKEYAAHRGDGRVYTPQIVVNGGKHFVGSNKRNVMREIERQLARPAEEFVPVSFEHDKQQLAITVGIAGVDAQRKDATVWLVLVGRKVEQKITRGENRGKTIAYHSVVRKLIPVGMWQGDEKRIELPVSELMMHDVDDCVALVQLGDTGEIVGAGIVRGLNSEKSASN